MDRLFRNSIFHDESPHNSPKPQASSTVVWSDNSPKEMGRESSGSERKVTSTTSLCSTTSSLGVIDIDKDSLFSEKSKNASKRINETIHKNHELLEHHKSKCIESMKRRLDELSGGSDSLSLSHSESFSSLKGTISKDVDPKCTLNSSTCGSLLNGNASISKMLQTSDKDERIRSFLENGSFHLSGVSDSEFQNGSEVLRRIENDRKEFAPMLHSPANVSFESANKSSRMMMKSISEYMKSGSYNPDELFQILRNNPTKSTDNESGKEIQKIETCPTDAVPTASARSVVSCVKDVSFGSNDEVSTVSSIASVNHIADMLQRQSFGANPKEAIEKLLGVKSSTKKKENSSSIIPPIHRANNSDRVTKNDFPFIAAYDQTKTPTMNESLKTVIEKTPETITCPAREFYVSKMGKVMAKNREGIVDSDDKTTSDSDSVETSRYIASVKSDATKKTSRADSTARRDGVGSSSRDLGSSSGKDITVSVMDSGSNGGTALSEKLIRGKGTADVIETTADPVRFQLVENDPSFPLYFEDDGDSACSEHISLHGEDTDNGNNSSVRNISEPAQRVTIPKMDSDLDYWIDAGILCVGTQVEAIITVNNPTNFTLSYRVRLTRVASGDEVDFRAAKVNLSSAAKVVELSANRTTDVKVTITPSIVGEITAVLEFSCVQTNFPTFFRTVKLIGEEPKLKLEVPSNKLLDLGDLSTFMPKKSSRLLLKNDGLSRLPVKFILQKKSARKPFVARATIEPQQRFKCDVLATLDKFAEISENATSEWILSIFLDTLEEEEESEPLLEGRVRAGVLAASSNEGLILDTGECERIVRASPNGCGFCEIVVRNDDPIAHSAVISRIGDEAGEFSTNRKTLELPPGARGKIGVTFAPHNSIPKREIQICIQAVGCTKQNFVKIVGILENTSGSVSKIGNSDLIQNSDASSGSSAAPVDGPLRLDCTHHKISWVNVPVHAEKIQTITLRNRGCSREKLSLTIEEKCGRFKFVEQEQESFDKSLKLTLDSKESRKISVAFIPYMSDKQASGKIIIARRGNLDNTSFLEAQKVVIPMYGYGGHSSINYHGVFTDREDRLWITLDEHGLEAKFSVENFGDAVAFVHFSLEEPDDAIFPEAMTLYPKEQAEVDYRMALTEERLEAIKKGNKASRDVLAATSLHIIHGCESTRLRIKRMWPSNEENGAVSQHPLVKKISGKLDSIVNVASGDVPVEVNDLLDSPNSLHKLWHEGIQEDDIGILIKRSCLESIALDSTVIFKDLLNDTVSSKP